MNKRNHRRILNANKRRHPLTPEQASTKMTQKFNRAYLRKFNRLVYLANRGLGLYSEAKELRDFIESNDPIAVGHDAC